MSRRVALLLVLALSSSGLAACTDLTGPLPDQAATDQYDQGTALRPSGQITQGTGIRSSGAQITQGTGI